MKPTGKHRDEINRTFASTKETSMNLYPTNLYFSKKRPTDRFFILDYILTKESEIMTHTDTWS